MYPGFRTALLASASILAVSAAGAAAQDTEAVTLDTITLTATTDASVQAEGLSATTRRPPPSRTRRSARPSSPCRS